ncbi:putative rmlC-like jelly roll protein [Medicago truncatula]|uniref:Putative rmlC-like jelly roll protein n=2 Tax=Medicago truncatula TaxID=3880 RepID=G7K2A1_MEDTR|nr:RmlC-like cupins superfamily protein [Medicago truncatula]RHN53281.1 putative rmlC-like jelly roll protein [Medicago truncatula]
MAAYEVFGVKIEKNPSKSKLIELSVSTWPKWEGGPLKIPRSFKEEETMYLVEGKVKVTVEEKIGSFEIGGGDLVVFPKGMTITWEITEPVKKHSSWKKE